MVLFLTSHMGGNRFPPEDPVPKPVLQENGFIENGYAPEDSDFRKRLKEQYGVAAEFYNTQKEYRTNLLAKWNVHNEQVFRMMKKAVSFRPIVDIQKFITENICDIPDKPDIVAMQQNIRDYKRHEQLAQQQEDKLTALQEISKLYREMMQAIERLQQQSFFRRGKRKHRAECRPHEGRELTRKFARTRPERSRARPRWRRGVPRP